MIHDVGPVHTVVDHDIVTEVYFAEIQFDEVERLLRLRFYLFNL